MARSPVLTNKANTALIVIDVQERLLPVIHNNEQLVENCVKLIKGFKVLNLPVFVTEQYPEGIGKTVEPIREVLEDVEVKEKMTFSCIGIEGFIRELRKANIHYTILCGIETHVCLWQSAMDLKNAGFNVIVAGDCVSSRKAEDRETALDRMIMNGVDVASTEMVLFELLETSEGEEFKQILSIIK